MPLSNFRIGLLGAAAVILAGPVLAQGTTGGSATPPAAVGNPAVVQRPTTTVAPGAGTLPAPGANSFTESQARGHIEAAGMTNVTGLHRDDQGIWRGRATRNGSATEVALDFHGLVVTGPAASARTAQGDAMMGTTPMAPTATRRDGPPGNPPGTAIGRAVDRTVGTNATGTNPAANRPDGAPGNPPSTMLGRAVDRVQGETPRPDGTPGNPPGTAVGRALGVTPR